MKAIVCEQFGEIEQLKLLDIDAPAPKPHEILIETKAIGVNFPDALMVMGLYQVKPPLPFSPGMEVAGVVKAVGEKVSRLKAGDRVVASCQTGGLAEQVCVPEASAFLIPESISNSEAAALLIAYGTAHHALKQRAQLQKGETLFVPGASGGTGLAAVQIGKAMGATVIAACSSDEKLEVAKANGADHLINYKSQDLKAELKRITQGKGLDVVYDPVGGDVFDICSRAMAWKGRLLVIGFASGKIPQLPVNLALVKGYSLVGVFWGEFTMRETAIYQQNMQELFSWIENNQFRPIIDSELPLEQSLDAMNKIIHRKVKGKIIINPTQ